MDDYTSDLSVEPEQLEAIGRVVVEWSYLESVLEAAIWNLAFPPDEDIATAITTHLGWRARMDILATLFDVRWDRGDQNDSSVLRMNRERADFLAIRAEVTRLNALRNEFVHSRWVRGGQGSPGTCVVEARGTIARKIIGRSIAEIKETARGIAEQSKRLRALLDVNEADELFEE